MCSFPQVLTQNLVQFLSKHWKTLHFQANRKSIGSSKKGYYRFSKQPSFSVKIFNIFTTLTLKQIFQKSKTFLKKLEYRFLVERTKIEKVSFPYKTAISEANFKTNRMVTSKWTCLRERSFPSNYFIFLKVLFQFKNL